MTKQIKHHADILRDLVKHHAENIHGAKWDNLNESEIHQDSKDSLKRPLTPDEANIDTLPYHDKTRKG